MKMTLWKIVAAGVAVLLSPLAVEAGVFSDCSACDPCEPVCGPCDIACKPKKSLFEFGGWLDAGIYGNEYGQSNAYNNQGVLRGRSGNTNLLGNVRQSDFQVNQGWLYAAKKVSGKGLDIGGRIDAVFGTDARLLQSQGLEIDPAATHTSWNEGDYYTALPQAYAELGINKLSIKVGKVLSPLGYETIASPDRFFYSLSYAWLQSGPGTLSGIVGTYEVNKKLTVYGAWGQGDKFFYNMEEDSAAVAGAILTVSDRLSLSYGTIIGRIDNGVAQNHDYFIQSIVADLKLTQKLNYVFEWTVRNDSVGATNLGEYGINNELFYSLTKKLSVGARAEWMHLYGGYGSATATARPLGGDHDLFALTLGANWKPTQFFTLKGEARYDSAQNVALFDTIDGGRKDTQWSFGVSGVVHF
ncbi:MAG: porin [Planctomycetaceae bacterium]|jgi:hypothetical protein|nr:porin [Planctomycetaceae bacterium]